MTREVLGLSPGSTASELDNGINCLASLNFGGNVHPVFFRGFVGLHC